MEDNRKFATFFADAPKGKKIGAVLSWIATVILLVALFVPGYQLRYQMKTEKGTFKDIPATMTSELKQMKEAAKLNFQFGAGTTSDKIDEFVEKGSTSVFSYLVSPDLQKARLVNLETMSDASDDISKICVALLVLFFVLVVAAAIASVFTISWCALVANLIGIIELLAVYFFVFAGKFSIDPTDTSITSRVAPALTMILIVLLVLAAIMSVASVIVSYAVHEDEEAFVDDWNSNDPSRDAETNLVDDGNATTVPATDNSMTVVASLIQMNTNRSFAIYNNTEVVIGKGSQANIIVSNPIISRAHAKISCRNGVCTIQDLGSKNGTFVGDEKILAFQVLHGVKVLSALFGGFTLQTLGFLAVTFCRVPVTPKQGGLLFREVGFFRSVTLAAVKQSVLARVVLRLWGNSRHIQNSFCKQITHKLSPSLQVYSGMPCFGAAFAVSSAAHLRIVAAWFLYFLPVDAI